MTFGLENAEVAVWPRDEPPPIEHEAMLALRLGFVREPREGE